MLLCAARQTGRYAPLGDGALPLLSRALRHSARGATPLPPRRTQLHERRARQPGRPGRGRRAAGAMQNTKNTKTEQPQPAPQVKVQEKEKEKVLISTSPITSAWDHASEGPEVPAGADKVAGPTSKPAGAVSSAQSGQPSPPGETGLLWFDNLYPIRRSRFDLRFLLRRFALEKHLELLPVLKKSCSGKEGSLEILAVMPRPREAGCFVRFCTRGPLSALQVERAVQSKLRAEGLHGFLTRTPIRAALVKGVPLMEDLADRFPSAKLKIHLHGAEVSEDALFPVLREYGRLQEMTLAKDVCTAQYVRLNGAVGARNCLHNYTLQHRKFGRQEGDVLCTTLSFQYEPVPLQSSKIISVIKANPRLFLPGLFVLLVLTTTMLFDPIRTLFIQAHVTDSYKPRTLVRRFYKSRLSRALGLDQSSQSRWKEWLGSVQDYVKAQYTQRFQDYVNKMLSGGKSTHAAPDWVARQADEAKLRAWLQQPPDRVLLLAGPAGCGKMELVRACVTEKKNNNNNNGSSSGGHVSGRPICPLVHLDLESVLEDGNSEDLVNYLVRTLHFYPGFTFVNYAGMALDVFTPGAAKAAGGVATEKQVNKILEVVEYALLKAREHVSDTSKLPLFVISGLSDAHIAKKPELAQALFAWADRVTCLQVARVLFAVEDLDPNNFKTKIDIMLLEDASTEDAIDFVVRSVQHVVGRPLSERELEAIGRLGGRFSDLMALVESIKNGTPPLSAAESILKHGQDALRGFLLGSPSPLFPAASTGKAYVPALWPLCKYLVKSPEHEVSYNFVLFNLFKGDEAALRTLTRTNCLRVVKRTGAGGNEEERLRAGSPVVLEAMRRLCSDKAFSAGLDTQVIKAKVASEMSKVNDYEKELKELKELALSPLVPKGYQEAKRVADRTSFLVTLLSESHQKLVVLEQQRKEAEEVINAALAS